MSKGCALVLSALGLLEACSGSSDQAPPVAQAPHAPTSLAANRGASPQEQTRGMVEAAGMGTSQLPVTVKFELTQKPVIGQAQDVAVAVLPGIAAAPARIQVTASDGLVLSPAGSELDLPVVDPTQVYRHSITITPTAEGVQMVSVAVMLHHDDTSDTRVFQLPVIVGQVEEGTAPAKH